jgi:FkbM family methyltransferase
MMTGGTKPALARRLERAARSAARSALDSVGPAIRRLGTLSYGRPIVLEDRYGIRFVLYPWDGARRWQKRSRRFYRDEFAALQRLIGEGYLVVDVGANIGLHSTLFSRWVGPQGRVIAFEPVPETVWRLRETLALNACRNVAVVESALLAEPGTARMNTFERQYADWNSFGLPRFGGIEPVGSIDVRVDTLDAFAGREGIEHIDFLKLDIEGSELDALRGAKGLLADGRISVLSFEISQVPLAGTASSSRAIFDLLASFGYAAYRFDAGPPSRFSGPVTDSQSYYENYYASRTELT